MAFGCSRVATRQLVGRRVGGSRHRPDGRDRQAGGAADGQIAAIARAYGVTLVATRDAGGLNGPSENGSPSLQAPECRAVASSAPDVELDDAATNSAVHRQVGTASL